MKPTREEELKALIRKTYNVFFYMTLFLAIPAIGYYIIGWKWIQYAQDIGSVLFFLGMWKIKYAMKKKQKKEQKGGD